MNPREQIVIELRVHNKIATSGDHDDVAQGPIHGASLDIPLAPKDGLAEADKLGSTLVAKDG